MQFKNKTIENDVVMPKLKSISMAGVLGKRTRTQILSGLRDIVKAPNIQTKKSAFTIQLRRYKCSIINRLSYKKDRFQQTI